MKNENKALAKVGDPIVAANGDIMMEEVDAYDDDVTDSDLEAPRPPTEFKDYRPDVRRVTKDLRAPKDLVNAASVIFTYTMLGISDTEIQENTGISAEDLVKVRESRTYSEIFEAVMRSLINANSEYLEARIAAHTGMAATSIFKIASTSRNTGHRLAAAKDILDRGGHRPQDKSNGATAGLNELRIVITNSDEHDTKIEFNTKGN